MFTMAREHMRPISNRNLPRRRDFAVHVRQHPCTPENYCRDSRRIIRPNASSSDSTNQLQRDKV